MADIQFTGQIYLAETVELCADMLAVDAEAIDLCNGLLEEQLSSSIRPGHFHRAEPCASSHHHIGISTRD
jgi:hypothetical protein